MRTGQEALGLRLSERNVEAEDMSKYFNPK